MILTDQDVDGSHIKGLFINFINVYWPTLTQLPGFIISLATPIVKAKKNKIKVTNLSSHSFLDCFDRS